jgi:pimeloyl-ACP methyl ester carboxylesterase
MPYARNGSVELWYETFGPSDRPALLLVNGLGSQCINYKQAWCERFVAAGFSVIRFDNRDVGRSTHLHEVAPDVPGVLESRAAGIDPVVPYALTDMAADAVAVLDAVGVERAHVMGLSMGGMIVQTMAIEHPERVLSMTSVMSSTGDADVGQPAPEANALLFSPPPTDRRSYVERHVAGLRIWGSPACFDEARLRADAAAAFDRCFDPAGQARQLMAIMAAPSRTEALGRVRVPTLVLHGDADRLVDPSGGRRTAEAVPGARFVLLEGMGHDYPPEYWDRWVALVADHAGGRGVA